MTGPLTPKPVYRRRIEGTGPPFPVSGGRGERVENDQALEVGDGRCKQRLQRPFSPSPEPFYQDPGADYFERRHDPAIEAKRLQHRIEAVGYAVTITEKAA